MKIGIIGYGHVGCAMHKLFTDAVIYGGSCFPKDIMALLRIAEINETDLSLLNAVKNKNMKYHK